MFLRTRPGAECAFHPRGTPLPVDYVSAGDDGRVRFYAPPSSWGSELTVDCTSSTATTSLAIDLNDPGTYQVDVDALQKPLEVSIKPALTGDLLALSPEKILQAGYPPRPDKATNPAAYEQWVAIVSVPRKVQPLTFISAPGHQAGNYQGAYNSRKGITGAVAWCGRVYDYRGWTLPFTDALPTPNYVSPFNPYTLYEVNFVVPPAGTIANTRTYIWSGIGGMEAVPQGYSDGLIQSGIALVGTSAPQLFAEYVPAAPRLGSQVGNFPIHPGDSLYAWGWSSPDSSCSGAMSSHGDFACFDYFNQTTGTYFTDSNGSIPYTAHPANTFFLGWTYETIVERPGSNPLDNFPSIGFWDISEDYKGFYHSVTSDPWIYLEGFVDHTQIMSAWNPQNNDDYPFFVDYLKSL